MLTACSRLASLRPLAATTPSSRKFFHQKHTDLRCSGQCEAERRLRPCLIHTCHAAPGPCHDHAVLKATFQGHGTARHGIYELPSAVQTQHVSDLPAFGFFRLPRGVPRRMLSEACQSVKLQDCQFGYFRIPRGFSRRIQYCWRMAGARHGMCGLTRHGMGMCELVFGVTN
jgi:hypothetical protein